jgi:hypothetical protein
MVDPSQVPLFQWVLSIAQILTPYRASGNGRADSEHTGALFCMYPVTSAAMAAAGLESLDLSP